MQSFQAKKCEIDVPIGCVIKKDRQIIAASHNRRELDNDITAHAEILAIREAQKARDNKVNRLRNVCYSGTMPDVRLGNYSERD